MSEMGLSHVHWTILNHNLKLTVVFLITVLLVTLYNSLYFRNSLEKPQLIKERDKGEFGVYLCVPGYINPPSHCRSTGLNGENGERVLQSVLEGGGCTKEKGLSEFDVRQGNQGMFCTLLKNPFLKFSNFQSECYSFNFNLLLRLNGHTSQQYPYTYI